MRTVRPVGAPRVGVFGPNASELAPTRTPRHNRSRPHPPSLRLASRSATPFGRTMPPKPLTETLLRSRRGDRESLDGLLAALYDELRALAARYLGRERGGHTLQPTGLAHEAFLRLVDQHSVEWTDRTHFMA